jgi:1,4-dihydroxy-2-naphthoyl-CoA hydrolase
VPTDDQRALAVKGFDAHYGLDLLDATGEEVRARCPVADHVLQPVGLVHGGVYAAMAESMASIGTVVATEGPAAGMSNHTSFLRPVTEGTIHAVARARHRGRSTYVWEVDFTDDAGRLCAVSRVTIAVLGARDGQPR